MTKKNKVTPETKNIAPGKNVPSKSFMFKAFSFACLLVLMYLSVLTDRKSEQLPKDYVTLKTATLSSHDKENTEPFSHNTIFNPYDFLTKKGALLGNSHNELVPKALTVDGIEDVVRNQELPLDKVFNPYAFLRRATEPSGKSVEVVEVPNHSIKIALLISFPNSGTSYTLKNTRHVSNITTASNYCGHDDNDYKPVWRDDPNSPQPHLIPENAPHKPPRDFILTKTHCHHCDDCPPHQYVVSHSKFQRECLTECVASSYGASTNRITSKTSGTYALSEVGKVVHLIRNPFDNIISRFHCFMNGALKRIVKPKYAPYSNIDTNSIEGFKKFCSVQDARYIAEEREAFGDAIMDIAQVVPCHSDFLRYIVWHNHAFEMTKKWESRIQIETHILHYEDYRLNFNATVEALLDFLEMPWASEPDAFHRSNYSGYYTVEEISAIRTLVRITATEATLAGLRRYGF